MNSLAFMYAEGIGVEKDKVKAESCFDQEGAERELISQALEEEAGPEDYTLPDGGRTGHCALWQRSL